MHFLSDRDRYLGMVGQHMLRFFPDRVKRLEEGGFTLSQFGERRDRIDSILRRGLIYQAVDMGDLDRLAQYHENYWKGDAGTKYHEDYSFEFEKMFVPKFAYIVEMMSELMQGEGMEIKRLVEIGSGSGQLIEYLDRQMDPQIKELIGIDLSPQTVAACNAQYGNERVRFLAADGDAWIRENGQAESIFMSHRGVLEYFPQERLLSFLQHIATHYRPSILVTIEPVGVNHNFAETPDSTPYSDEYSFSHNYPDIIKQAGFEVLHTDRQDCNEMFDLLAVVAVVAHK